MLNYDNFFKTACFTPFFPPTNPVDPVDEIHVLAASANHQSAHNDDVSSKVSGKKQKNETDKGKREEKNNACLHVFATPYLCHVITC